MANYKVTDTELTSIANAIRTKGGISEQLEFPTEFISAIGDIPSGGNLGTKSISSNGTYDPEDDNLDGYSEVTVNVPNSYAAGDEGKVVSQGALVAQSARSSEITANGTYDTTLNNEVTVNVSGGGGGGSFPSLPSGYKRVEYISADGNQWAEVRNVNIEIGKTIRITLASSATDERCVFGYSASNNSFECYTDGDRCEASGYGKVGLVANYKTSTGLQASIATLKNQKQLIVWYVFNGSLTNAYICKYRSTNNDYLYKGKIYRITVSDSYSVNPDENGNIVYDFIPCYRTADNVVGFYEVKTDEFYPSESGTAFVKGPDA